METGIRIGMRMGTKLWESRCNYGMMYLIFLIILFNVFCFGDVGVSGIRKSDNKRNETSRECQSIQTYGISAKQPRANITKECET
jgi:hypothetical protein